MDSIDNDIAIIGNIAVVPSILEVVCQATGMGFAAVARVTDDRWVACRVKDELNFGLVPGGELKLESTICHEIRQTGKAVVFDNADDDPVFAQHHTPQIYGLKSYISMPIVLADGRFFGTLCAIDPKPARINNAQIIGMFTLFADLIARHIEGQERVTASQTELANALALADLREQFIAVLGHDLRNPLGAISAGAELLSHAGLAGRSGQIVATMKASAGRMAELVDNILDLARGRLGEGVLLNRQATPQLASVLNQVIAELQSGSPDRVITTHYALRQDVWCDNHRIAQLFSNLLANAMNHGATAQTVHVEALSGDNVFQLSVANAGMPISPDAMTRLFKPFARGDVKSSQQGLGLGLYIASEIAKAHGGTLEAISNLKETRFTLTIPCQAGESQNDTMPAITAV